MNILVDIGHPAHVHLFKNFIRKMEYRGHKLYITVRQIKSAIDLLDYYGLDYYILGNKSNNIIFKGFSQIKYDYILFKLIKNKRIDISIGSPFNIAHAANVNKTISIILDDDDDDVQPLMTRFGHPFSDFLLSPDVLLDKRKRESTIYYPSYHELAYLHPNNFEPNQSVLKSAGIKKGETFFILRFNAFKAHHDRGIEGISIDMKRKLINILSDHGKVFITNEDLIEAEFEKYKLPIPSYEIHSLLYFATMFIGDSQTMSSESAVLGVPSIRINSFAGRISYLNEQENKYGLTFGFKPHSVDAFEKIKELLNIPNLKLVWQERRKKMLNDKIDLTSYLIWFVENLPESPIILKNKPELYKTFM